MPQKKFHTIKIEEYPGFIYIVLDHRLVRTEGHRFKFEKTKQQWFLFIGPGNWKRVTAGLICDYLAPFMADHCVIDKRTIFGASQETQHIMTRKPARKKAVAS